MAKRWIFPQVCELWFVSSCGLIAMEIGYALLLLLGLGIYIYYISNHPIVNWHGIALKNCHLVDACSIGKGSFRLLLVGWLTAGYQKSHAPKIQK